MLSKIFSKKNKKTSKPNKKSKVVEAVDVPEDDEIIEKEEFANDKPRTSSKKKRRNELMKSVLHEFVADNALESFRANTKFVKGDAESKNYYGLYLHVDQIGGLSKKQQKDEAKGSIVQAINSGNIKTLITDKMLEEEVIIFIPDKETLINMDEFSLFSEPNYGLAIVDQVGDYVVEEGVSVELQHVIEYAADDDSDIDDFLAFVRGEDLPVGECAADEDDAIPIDDYDENEGVFEEDEDHEEYDEPSDLPPTYEEEEDDSFSDDDLISDEGGLSPFEEIDEFEEHATEMSRPDEIIQVAEDFEKELTRRFFEHDLDIAVSMDAFNAHFANFEFDYLFDVGEPEGWLDPYTNNLYKQANADLKRFHDKKRQQMREDFMAIISIHAGYIGAELDLNKKDTDFGRMKLLVEDERGIKLKELERKVHEKEKEIKGEFDEKCNQVGDDARQAAMASFRRRYDASYQERIYSVENNLKEEIDLDYTDALRAINESRKEAASAKMEYGVINALKSLSEDYQDFLKDEALLYEDWRTYISEYVDQNRKNDISYIETTREQLNQTQMADNVRSEMTSKLKSLGEEFTVKEKNLLADIENTERLNKNRLAEMKDSYETQISNHTVENEKLQTRIDELVSKIATIDDDKERLYEKKMTELIDDRKIWQKRFEEAKGAQTKFNMFFATFGVIIVLAAGFVGYMISGSSNAVETTGPKESPSIIVEDSRSTQLLEQQRIIEEAVEKGIEKREKEKEVKPAEVVVPEDKSVVVPEKTE